MNHAFSDPVSFCHWLLEISGHFGACPSRKGWCRCSPLHFGAHPGNHGAGGFLLRQDDGGPLSFISLGVDFEAIPLSLILRSYLVSLLVEVLGVSNLERGTSSSSDCSSWSVPVLISHE